MRRVRRAGLRAVALVVVAAALGGLAATAVQAQPAEPPETANVEVRVWQRIADPLRIYVSARPEGGSWETLGTIPLPLDDGFSSSGSYRYGDITVETPHDRSVVEVRVWQRIADSLRIYVSARPEGGSWEALGTIPLPLDDGRSSDGNYRYGDITVETEAVGVPAPAADSATPADRSQCRIDEATAAKVIASTVKVITPTRVGSAFYIGNGQFVTSAHVVDNRPAQITLRNRRINVTAVITGLVPDNQGDLAILSASAPGLSALEWANSIGVGAEVAVVGYPLGQGVSASISRGIVSRSFTDSEGVSLLQTDAPANAGNSGGPLVDACGCVAGVISWKFVRDNRGDATEGLAFAVSEPSLGRLVRAIGSGQYGALSNRFIAVSAGGMHSCGIRTDGTLACWGWDGNREATPPTGRFSAVSASATGSTGGAHTCGIRSDGTLACWGWNKFGQTKVPTGRFTTISAGGAHTCGIRVDGTLRCWGGNYSGQAISPDDRFTAVSAGLDHTCGIKNDGTLFCWGADYFGQATPPTGRFIAVGAGGYHTCGIRLDETLACWGDDNDGLTAPPAGRFTAISAGIRHACGIRIDRTLACWGWNEHNQAVPPAGRFSAISDATLSHTCGIRTDGILVCWGWNDDGQATPP